jgi:hypothetical protein
LARPTKDQEQHPEKIPEKILPPAAAKSQIRLALRGLKPQMNAENADEMEESQIHLACPANLK